MIKLTTLNGNEFYLNPDLIYRVEEMPDTTITLTIDKVILVKESADQVNQLIVKYRRLIFNKRV
ncbi:MAG: flagellar FlbD family protein [Liquorilactobacillus sp.]|uniref:flagellar FlbD family protein n=1 Tax=Liquorilactobacillus nagelii TaxID=82688 RepID=UPI0039ECF61F